VKTEEKKTEEQKITDTASDKPLDLEQLRKVWNEFAELRKNQLAEYQLLKRGYVFKENKLSITLDNPIEEQFLQGIRSPLIAYLRDKMSNSLLLVVGIMREEEASRPMIYTNKEKFDYLLDKNPALKDLQQRFGLDADY